MWSTVDVSAESTVSAARRTPRPTTPRSSPGRRRPAGRRAVALLLGAASVLGACGGDGGGDVSAEAVPGVVEEPGQTNDHLDEGWTYDADPPSGGDHAPIWLNCGVYDVEVPNQFAVHALEHGVVWFAHRPDLSEDQVNTLLALYELDPDRVIVSPYPGLEADVVAVAWERRLVADGVEDPRLIDFLETFANGANAPEPRAPCNGGVGL